MTRIRWYRRQNRATRQSGAAVRWMTARHAATALIAILCGAAMLGAGAGAVAQSNTDSTLERVRERGELPCGVKQSVRGFSAIDEHGAWAGFDVDYCRVVAAAVLGDARAVEFLPVTNATRFTALAEGGIDLLAPTATWTYQRDTGLGLSFTVTTFYDGQGFMARRDSGWNRLSEVRDATICVLTPSTTLDNLIEYIGGNAGLSARVLPAESLEGRRDAFFGRRCDLVTGDRSDLLSMRTFGTATPEDYVIFPDVISREPLGPVVRADDVTWFNIVRWAIFATIAAEEYGITSANADAMRDSPNPEIRRFLGSESGMEGMLGLEREWVVNVIRQVGNYREIYDRNLGADTPFALDRGLNDLWTRGGLLYAPPLQ